MAPDSSIVAIVPDWKVATIAQQPKTARWPNKLLRRKDYEKRINQQRSIGNGFKERTN